MRYLRMLATASALFAAGCYSSSQFSGKLIEHNRMEIKNISPDFLESFGLDSSNECIVESYVVHGTGRNEDASYFDVGCDGHVDGFIRLGRTPAGRIPLRSVYVRYPGGRDYRKFIDAVVLGMPARGFPDEEADTNSETGNRLQKEFDAVASESRRRPNGRN